MIFDVCFGNVQDNVKMVNISTDIEIFSEGKKYKSVIYSSKGCGVYL